MKNNSSKAPNYFNTDEGQIKKLKAKDPRPRNMSAIAGEKLDQVQVTTTVHIYTGITEAELNDLKFAIAIDWLSQYLEAEGSEDYVEGDVYTLLANPLVRGWWLNEWMKRDREIVPEMAHNYRRIMEEEDENIQYRKAIVRHRMKSEYENLHRQCILNKSPDYKTLERSYAIMWKLIR